MAWFPSLGGFLGGLGLFLLGMWLMTEGLKLAAGRALERILGSWTRTRSRGLFAGVLITSIVQSSSAVTVATIGFANAGLLTLGQAVWVIFGSNVGTTMTGWLVALVGFNLRIEALALPLLGVGMVLRFTGEGTRRAAWGTALAGFGALFLGIDVLRNTFAVLGTDVQLAGFEGEAVYGTLVYVAAGVVLTVLMQSSSAALAVALTAAGGGLIPLVSAAAVVIGTNVGTTVKAMLAAIGATPNARRTAAAHVIFNLLTALVALALLPWLVALIEALRAALGLEAAPATTLALFHTSFNLLGIALIWPVSGRLIAFLQERFRTAEEDEARPRYLDVNVATVPSLALDALALELKRLGGMALRMARRALGGEARIAREQHAVDALARAIGEFAARLNRASMSPESAEHLPEILRVARYYDAIGELLAEMAAMPPAVRAGTVGEALAALGAEAAQVLALADVSGDGFSLAAAERAHDAFQARYQETKALLLRAGAEAELSVGEMEARLRQASLARRVVEQAVKAARRLDAISPATARAAGPTGAET